MTTGEGRPLRGGFTNELRKRFDTEWRATHHDHPFVTGIGDGTLSLDRFRYFMQQDYLFLIDYARAIAIATAKSPDLESMGRFAKLLDETLNSEMSLHRSFCADFGISEEELTATQPSETTISYTKHLVDTAYEHGIAEIAAALLPCQWGYDDAGQRLAANLTAPEGSLHARWVAGYNDPEYREVTAWLRGFTDRLAEDASDEVRESMAALFKESLHQEWLFWEAPMGL
ncbi:MAG: thiaminase II [Dehalococcoidia bacterium]|jgi:thiaminase/transcriptional activator TenA|nr:thiaminase II [Dehalococcoidia bacterium]